MGPLGVARLSLALGLLAGLSLQQTARIGATCPCQQLGAKSLPRDRLADDTFSYGTVARIHCCKDIVLGYHDPGASIQWSFNGEPFSEGWASSLRPSFCAKETIMTRSVKVTDRGNYSCTITTTNATAKTFSMKMTLQYNKKYREVPTATKKSQDVVAKVGESVHFSCEGFVGTNETIGVASLWWTKYFPNNTRQGFAKMLPDVNIKQVMGSGGSWGMIKGQLVISSVQEIHYGTYQCRVTNMYGTVLHNMTLTDGVPVAQAMLERYRTTVVVVASLLGVLVVALLGWRRWRRLLLLYCRHRTAFSDGHQYDVFLVHGDSASRWVWSVLLPALEDSLGYSCFLPQRDMCGGSLVAESILEALTRCRRVVVVMTPCLLNSPWAAWATYSGIQTALTSRARILALVHKKQSFMSGSQDQNPFLNVLKVVRKIRVPEELAWPLYEEESPLQHCDTPTQGNVQRTELKLMIPEINISASSSNSPALSQKLSNMISGSNAASREDLDCEKEKTAQGGGPVVFTGEDHSLQDPGSPSSVTPFILPSCFSSYRPPSNGSVCQSVGWCLKMVCIGKPEEQFWQKLRLRLGPPSLSRAKSTDK
ncbi:Single Ig IL-1-related receptor [Chionoecetes opilio]|uniref:Soluble interferon alpha/beta receptor OPG204 n=1 Tax=Chionoecetes opilio TaxID=41210 RepID=A0A8J4YLS7_CHIOP|nr:Single Ig IL-1-related receptor [Chionoecetes opilio]